MNGSFEQRKTAFANAILQLKDEQVLMRLQEALGMELQMAESHNASNPMSMDEFQAMLDQSEADIRAGRCISAEALKKEIAAW